MFHRQAQLILRAALVPLLAAPVFAAQVELVQVATNDVPGGGVIGAVDTTNWLETAQTVTTVTAPELWNGTRFTHWTVSSKPSDTFRDSWGRAENPARFTLYEYTTAVAHYLPASLDSDGDGVPDWYKLHYYGTLEVAASSDGDGDGLTLLQEYQGGTHPLYANSSQAGGIARATSEMVVVNLEGYARYTLRSEPAGAVAQSEVVRPGTVITTPNMMQSTFGYWTLDGVQQRDAWGVALRQNVFTMEGSDREAVAYLFAGDSDGDGLPDAWEWYHCNTLEHGAGDDLSGDGRTLSQNYAAGQNPRYGYETQLGGIARTTSEMVVVNLEGFARYTISSEPAGTVYMTAVTTPGTVITTPNMMQSTFGYWTLDGVQQRDAWGVTLRQISFVVDGADREGVAYLFAADSDGDGINDGFEQFYYGSLTNGAESDTDGDGLSLLAEYTGGSLPHIGNIRTEGGVYWADSDLLVANLQPFERLRFAQVDGVLTEIYSFDPYVVTGWGMGDRAAVALGDWDGDEDWDLFLAHDGGLKVYENIGTRRTVYLSERTSRFSGPASLIAGIESPVLSAGDFDGDGYEDLAIGGETGVVRLVKSSGNFTGSQPGTAEHQLDTGSTRTVPALGDLNGDGFNDLLAIVGDGTARAYFHSGTNLAPYETFIADYLGEAVTNASGVGIANVDFTGLQDVIVADADGRMWEFFNEGGGSFFLKSKVWAGAHQGFASRLAIAPRDYDGDGDTDVIAGMENGGLIGLRDPRVRRPTGLVATLGAVSILLAWDPDPQSRIKGYHVYRSTTENGSYERLNASLLAEPRFEDQTAAAATEYWYYVTGVTEAYYPGNSHPVTVESAASDKVTVTAESGRGTVVLRVKPGHGAPGNNVKIRLVLDESAGIWGEGLALQITYPAADLTPRSQADPGKETLLASGISQALVLTNDSATANGSFSITGSGGETLPGKGTFLTLNFIIGEDVAHGSALGVVVSSATMRDLDGNLLNVTIIPGGIVDVDGAYMDGDLTGDGAVDYRDEDLLKELIKPHAREATEEELQAGDLNGDGNLDQKDWLMLKRLLAGKPME